MRARRSPNETVLPRITLMTEPEGYVVALECFCGVAVQYPGIPPELKVSNCPNCGQSWRCLEPRDLLRMIGG